MKKRAKITFLSDIGDRTLNAIADSVKGECRSYNIGYVIYEEQYHDFLIDILENDDNVIEYSISNVIE